ncbi:nuclear transport factor 2 family protein [Burkholderia sp. R-69927]|nr:nuclear transport factor 2 family protein [Burkholderia sp. R-70199]MBK5088322.1 nuclear transport factor 2 family protein [Burkholderia sp. R-69927]MBK5123776.1 nuclear transport factor 2 family protein [Burkholderia sp. R-69980]MBK5165413.1 nuclear transport factor 2 family protein [Burkholderia sp. R-70211]
MPFDAAPATLGERIARLEAIEAIRALKAHYGALADAKYTADYRKIDADALAEVARRQAACFTEDAVWAGGNGFGGDLVGREAIARWFLSSPWRYAMHYYVSEALRVDVTAGEAEATWRLMQVALRDGDDTHARAVWLGAVTSERYRRDPVSSRWLISYMKFTDLQMMTLADTPLPIARNFAGLDAIRAARTQDIPQ